jgi:hypothetical protein
VPILTLHGRHPLGRPTLARGLVVAMAVACTTLAGPLTDARASREIPVGIYNVNNARLQDSPNRMYAIRFVLDQNQAIYRLWTGFAVEGVYTDDSNVAAPDDVRSNVRDKAYPNPPAPTNLPAGWTVGAGRPNYSHGTGGRIRARLVPTKADGTPDLANVLAQDEFNPVKRYRETKQMFNIPASSRTVLVHSNFGGRVLNAGVPYFVVYQNVDPNPRFNYVSLNSPVVKESVAGPNGRNTLDPNATGAIAGLDPREAVAWTLDGGSSWGWGQQVGRGPIPGDYTMSDDNAVKLPWYAWQEAPGAALKANQPYFAYSQRGSYTLLVKNSPRAVNLTQAGGYAPIGASVGVVTVKNLRSGEVGRTGALGTGIARGVLDNAVEVRAGDSYQISNSDTVMKAEGDQYLLSMGLIGSSQPYETVGNAYDRAELFALPHPWFVGGGAGSTPPPPTTVPPPSTTVPPPAPSRVSAADDLAAGKRASASSSETSFLGPAKAVDRDSTTRWSSAFLDGQWWKVDLGATRSISRVSINWEDAYAFEYRIETSVDGAKFVTAATVANSSPGWMDTTFTARTARYVRIVGVQRSTRYGISFLDARVGGPTGIQSARANRQMGRSCPRVGKHAKRTVRRGAKHHAAKRHAAKRRHSCRSKRRAASRRGQSTRQ